MRSLEEYYPLPWRKTVEEVADLRRQKGLKTQIAITVGQTIGQGQFEEEMPLFRTALESCWRLAHD
jgi:hypothetical protein